MLPGNKEIKMPNDSSQDSAGLHVFGDQLNQSQSQEQIQASHDSISLDHNYHHATSSESDNERNPYLTNMAEPKHFEEQKGADDVSQDVFSIETKSSDLKSKEALDTQRKVGNSSNERSSKSFDDMISSFKTIKDFSKNNYALQKQIQEESEFKKELTLQETNDEWKKTLVEFQMAHLEEITKRDDELDSNVRLVKDLNSRCYSLQDELSNSKNLATSLQYRQSKDQERIKSLQEEKSKNFEKFKILNDTLESKSKEIEELKVNNVELECKINTLKYEVKRKGEEHKKELVEIKESKIETFITFLKIDDLTVLSKSIDKYSSLLKELQSKPNFSRKQVEDRQSLIQLLKLIQEFKTKHAETVKELQDCRAKNDEIMQVLQDVKTNNVESMNLLESRSKELDATKEELELTKKSNQPNIEKLVLSSKVNEDLKSQIKVLNKEVETKLGEINEAKKKLKDINKLKKQNDEMSKKLVCSNKLNEELKCQNQVLMEEAESKFTAHLDEVHAININHTETIKAILSDLKARSEELKKSNRQNDEISRKLVCSNKLTKELKSRIKVLNEEMETNCTNHKDELQTMKSKNTEVLDLIKDKGNMAKKLESSYQLNDELRAQIDILNKYIKDKELVKFENDQKEVQSRISDLNEKIRLKDDQIKYLMKKEEQYGSLKVKNPNVDTLNIKVENISNGNGNVKIPSEGGEPLNQNDNIGAHKVVEYEKLNKTNLSLLDDKDSEISRLKKRIKNMESKFKMLQNNVSETSSTHHKTSSTSMECTKSEGIKKRRIY